MPDHHRRAGALAVLALAFVLLLPLRLLAQSASPSRSPIAAAAPCQRAALATDGPTWTTSGAWKGDELLLADNLNNALLRYSDTGRWLGRAPESLTRGFDLSGIRPYGSGFVLQMVRGSVVWVDKDFYPLRSTASFASAAKASAATILSQFNWDLVRSATPAAGGAEIVSFGDVQLPSGATKTGFYRYTVQNQADVTLLAGSEIDSQDPAVHFYLLGFPYVASIGSTAYMIDFAHGAPRLVESRGRDGVVALPTDLGAPRVTLPKFEGQQDVHALMAAVEKSTMPVGLYASQGFLYVLRHDGAAPHPTWTLLKIDPQSGARVGEATLPLRASHVTVVPGAKKWAFLEKGPVVGFGNQETRSAYFVPADAIFSLPKRGALCR